MKLGISTWSMLQSDLETAVRTIGDAGLEYIELWGEVPHAYPDWTDKKRLKDALSAYSFTVTMHAPFTDLNPAAPFEPVKGAVAKTLKGFLKFSESLGAQRVTFHPGSVHSGALVPGSKKDTVELFRYLVKESGGALAVNIENPVGHISHYHYPVGGSADTIEPLLESVEGAGFTMDSGHAHVNGEVPAKVFDRFSGRLTEIHLSDNGGASDDHLAPGDGTADLKSLFDRLRGTDTLVCLEVNPFKYSPLQVLHAAQALRAAT